MKNIIKLLVIALALTMLCGFAISCGEPPPEKEKVTLTVWGAEEDQAMLKEMCAAYAAANPDKEYKFLFGVQSEADAANKVLNDVQSGPDVFSFPSDQINMLYTGGALARIGGDIEATVKSINTADSVDAATLTINGEDQLYAYPSTGDNCYFVYYDKRVFTDESMLSSLDSMLNAAEAAGKQVHFKLNNDGWYLSSFFFADPDIKYEVTYDDNMTETAVDINYNNADGLKVMQSLKSYIARDGLFVTTDDSKIIAGFTPDANGFVSAAAAVTGTWNAATIKSLLGDNMGVCKLPTANIGGEQVQLSGYFGYKLMGVNGYSQQKAEAHKLAAWLTNEANQLKRFETRGFGPTNENVIATEAVQNDPVISVVLEQAEFNRTQKGVPGAYWTPMGSLITTLVTAKDNGTIADITDADLQELLDALVGQIAKQPE